MDYKNAADKQSAGNKKKRAGKEFGLSSLAIDRPTSIFILAIIIIIFGALSYKDLPRESSPDIQIPYLIVSLPYPGASPEDVESLVIHKLEKELRNLDNLKKISSVSAESAGITTLQFHQGTDIAQAKIDVREALDIVAPELPEETEDPVVAEINFSEFPIMILNISGNAGLPRLKEIAENIKEKIEGVPGVLKVQRSGGLEREAQIYVNNDKLRHYNLDINQIIEAIRTENKTIPAGDISLGPLKYMVRVPGEVDQPTDIKNFVAASYNNQPVFIRDLASVKFGFKEIASRSRLNSIESVSLSVSKRSGENLLKIADLIKDIVKKEQLTHGDKITFKILSDQSKIVNRFVNDLENNIYSGLFAVLLALLVTLGVRNAFFVASAIPFSMLISFFILQLLGITLNIVVLFSLIMALGMLVDNAIVVVENIYRHIELGKPPLEAAKTGAGEVAVPVIASTATTLAAFLPLLFMPGIMGEFMVYLPKILIISLLASLFVGLVINPTLCSVLMRSVKRAAPIDEKAFYEHKMIFRIYRRLLDWSLDHRLTTLLLALLFWIGSAAFYFAFIFPQAGVEFFPVSEPKSAVIHIKAPLGSNLKRSDNLVKEVEKILKPYYDKTDSIIANVGQGMGNMDGGKTPHLSHIILSFPNWEDRKMLPTSIIKRLREEIAGFSGAEYTLTKSEMGPPVGKAVNIEISGANLKTLKSISLEIQRRIKNVPGLVNLADNFTANRSEIQVVVDKEKAARLGLRTFYIADIVRSAVNGKKVSKYREGKDEYDIIARLDEKFRRSAADLARLTLKTSTGGLVSLGQVATIKNTPGLGSIRHKDTKRTITVSADAEGIPGAEALRKAKEKLEDYKPPAGCSLKYSGADESQKEMENYLSKSFLAAVFLIFLILVTQFNSITSPLIIVTSVLLSFIGVFLGMIIHGDPISVMMGGIGVISLAGVVVNNSIVLIDYIEQLKKQGLNSREAIAMGGVLRLRPVTLTAITTILALMPVTLGLDVNFARSPVFIFGSESGQLWLPMARAVMYGLGVATILTLIVTPALYSLIDSAKRRLFPK